MATNTDFLEFLKKEHQEENYQFLAAVTSYREFACRFFPQAYNSKLNIDRVSIIKKRISKAVGPGEQGDQMRDPLLLPGMPNEEKAELLQKLEDSVVAIFTTFIQAGAPKEVNIVVKTKQNIECALEIRVIHPGVFDRAYEHIYGVLHSNALSKFLKFIYYQSPMAESFRRIQNVTFKGMLLRSTISPYSFQGTLSSSRLLCVPKASAYRSFIELCRCGYPILQNGL